jgi:fermentation-respiration switch protein FrsA (DUF1100 family)
MEGQQPGWTERQRNHTMKSTIQFDSDGLTLAGDLSTPDGFKENGSYQAVIVQGSFTSVKEQMPGTYSRGARAVSMGSSF